MKNLLEEFEAQDLMKMIMTWVQQSQLKDAINVGYFYSKRYDLFDKIKPKDYSDWLE